MQWLLGNDTHPVDVNSRSSIIAIVYIAVIAPCVFILQPGYVQGLVEYLALSEEQAGYIASAEMFGIAFTTLLLIFMEARIDWRKLTVLCLVVAAAGNLLSLSLADFESLAAVRFLTGMGSGGLMSLTFAMMGLTGKSDRNFGYIITWVLIYGALGILVMPTAFATIGMDGVLLFFALFNVSGLFFTRYLPRSGVHHLNLSVPEKVSYSWRLKGVSLFALLVYNTSIGIVWAYLFLLGLEAGIAEQTVANVLTVSQFLGIAGAFVAVVLQLRIGRIIPLQVSIIGTANRHLHPGRRDRPGPVCPGCVPVQFPVEREHALPAGDHGLVRPPGQGGDLRYLHADAGLCHRPLHRCDHSRQEQL